MDKEIDVRKLNIFTQKLARSTSKILLTYFRNKLRIKDKKNCGIVTDADIAAEKYIISEILKKYPSSEILAEESKLEFFKGYTGNKKKLLWVIDPLDGTTNFASGIGWFCISIGTILNDRIISGVIYHPVMNEMFNAYLGAGAYLNGKKIVVSDESRLKNAVVSTGFYYMNAKELHPQMLRYEKIANNVRDIRRFGSAALDIAYTACGRYDAFFEYGLAPWDVAAGMLIASEAKAKISNYHGKKTSIFERNIIISNRKFHKSLVKLLE